MKRVVDYGFLIGLAAVAHGLLLFNDGVYWDDWYLHTALQQHNWPAIALLGQRGLPLDPILYWLIGYGGRVFAFKLVKFACLTLVALLTYESCLASGRIARGQALAIAALALTFPGDETAVILMTTDYAVYYAIFWLAVWLGFLSEKRSWCLYLAIPLFLISFNLNSLLVFYFAFVIAVFRFRKRDYVFLFLPFVFWLARWAWFAPKGYFASYNAIDLTPASLLRQTLQYGYFGLIQIRDMLNPPELIAIGIAAVIAYAIFRSSGQPFVTGPNRLGPSILFSLLAGVLAVLPYEAVRKAPAFAHGPNTRCEMLLAFPVASFIVWSIVWIFRVRSGLTRGAFVALAIVLAAFTSATVRTYLSWQAEWAKDRALMLSLSQHREGTRFATIAVCADDLQHDDYFVLGIDALLLGGWGSDSGVRIDPVWDPTDPRRQHPDELQSDREILLPGEHAERTFPPVGTLSLCVPNPHSDARVAATYLRDRFFQREQLPALFGRLAHVEFRQGQPPGACCQ